MSHQVSREKTYHTKLNGVEATKYGENRASLKITTADASLKAIRKERLN